MSNKYWILVGSNKSSNDFLKISPKKYKYKYKKNEKIYRNR